MTYRVLSPAEVKTFDPPTWLAHFIIPTTGLATLYGPPGIGKSFVALDLAHSIGTNSRWLSRRTRGGSVVYVAAGEGVSGLRARIEAWEHVRGLEVERVGYVTDAVPLHQSASVTKFLRVIREYDPALVVFDTLARCTAGMNENAVEDMGLAIAAADEIRRDTGAAVLFVHHTGRPDAEGHVHERGSSALPAAVDTLIELTGEEGSQKRTLRCRKQKDAEPFFPIDFELRRVMRAGRVLSLVPCIPACGDRSLRSA